MPSPSRMTDTDPIQTYPIGAPQTRHSSHRGNLTKLFFCFLVHNHSSILMHAFIHSSIHSSHTSKHCICNCCITTLRVASRSSSRLIRYERRQTKVQRLTREGLEAASRQHERQPTGVRRPALEGLEAALHQTEPGEKMQMSPSGPRPICSEAK